MGNRKNGNSKKRKRFKTTSAKSNSNQVPTSNKFGELEDDDDEMNLEETSPKEEKVPPIVINVPSIQPAERLKIYIKQITKNMSIKISPVATTTYPNGIEDQVIVNYLKTEKVPFHNFTVNSQKHKKLVIK